MTLEDVKISAKTYIKNRIKALYNGLRGSFLHPQWLVVRFNQSSQSNVADLSGLKILDIGSGDSNVYRMLECNNQVFRLDYPLTNQRYSFSPDIYGDACNLPIADNSQDAVLMFEVMEHVEHPAEVVSEIYRVLSDEGTLYISMPFLYPIHDAPHDYQRFTIYGLRSLLNRYDFDIIHESQHGNSLLVVLQLFNLALLEISNKFLNLNILLGVLAILLVYPFTILVNLLALFVLNVRTINAGCLGYFLIAQKKLLKQ